MARQAPRRLSPDTVPARRLRWLAYICLALAVLVLTVPYKVGVDDTFVQIRTGQLILEQGIPPVDPFSFTAGDKPYVEHEWGSSYLFYIIYKYSGVAGLMALQLLVISATCVCVVQTARVLGASSAVIVLVLPVVLFLVWGQAVLRPHLFTWLGLSVYSALVFRVRAGQLSPRWLWLIPPIHLVWASLYAVAVQGLLLLGCFGLWEALRWVRARWLPHSPGEALLGRVVLQMIALVPLCVLVSVVNPFGLRLLGYPLEEAALEAALDWNLEWLPVHRGIYHSPYFWVYLGILATLWLSWFACYRGRSRFVAGLLRDMTAVVCLTALLIALGHPPPRASFMSSAGMAGWQSALMVLDYAMLVLWMGHSLWRWWTIDSTQSLLVLLAVGVSFRYGRAVADAGLLLFPVLTTALTRWVAGDTARRARWEPRLIRIGLALAVGFMALELLLAYPRPWNRYTLKRLGVGLNTWQQPVCATDFLRRQGLTGRVLTTEGAWLLFQLWPAVRVSEDTRLWAVDAAVHQAIDLALKEPAAMAAYLQRFPSDAMVLRTINLSRSVHQFLRAQGWTIVHLEDRYMVLVPWRVPTAALIQTDGYHHIVPWENRDVTAANASAVLREAERAFTRCPGRADFAWSYMAQGLHALGRFDEARLAGSNIPKRLVLE